MTVFGRESCCGRAAGATGEELRLGGEGRLCAGGRSEAGIYSAWRPTLMDVVRRLVLFR
jgi:hypothetical protein